MTAIELNDVVKVFPIKSRLMPLKPRDAEKGTIAVDHVSVRIEAGEVCGLLGANGAGKTTIIKMLTGLIAPTEGSLAVCGNDVVSNRIAALRHVGAVIEEPAFFSDMSGWQNLKYFAMLQGGISDARIAETVELVGMSGRIHARFGNYSMGMRQRVGIAQALMHDPDVLLLDEPTNGLDPDSIVQMRELFRKIAHEYGKCVLISSHILGEMQQLCDRVLIMKKGKIAADFSDIADLGLRVEAICVVCDEPNRAREFVRQAYEGIKTKVEGTTLWIKPPESDAERFAAQINKLLIENDVSVSAVNFRRRTLEDAYREVTL